MAAAVAEALHHAHQQGVTHRDIKPSNLLLASDGRLSVTDFGLARMLEQPGMTVTGEFVGTPAYMSPEQVTAGRVPVDHRTDIYSLGATLYELLTLRPPFRADGRDRLLAMVIQKEPSAPRSIDPKVPRDLRRSVSSVWRRIRTSATRAPKSWRMTCAASSTASPSWPSVQDC
jgi:serine/threonine protein kinase